MDWLIQTYMEQLQQLITHCCSAEAGGYTPSDFPLAQVTQTELDQHVSHDQAIGNVENLYPLAPLQQGMLYHTLYQEEGSYVVQMTFRLRGRLDIESWRKAWSQTIEQFSVLRTSFHWKGWRMPHQQVHYQVDTGIQELDWRDWSAERQQQELEQYLQEDRRIGFNIAQSPLTRMTCIWMEDERVEVIWSYHHLILDGWSMPLVLRSLWEAYAALRNQERREVVAEVPYADYIAWIQKQDQQAAAHYWREQLSGNPEPTVIEGTRSRVKQEPSGIWYGELTTEQSRQLRKFAKQYQVTVQQVLQSVWALLLHHYSGEDDLLYGVTGAGRSAELTNVEKMVGLFINTLPTRVRVDGKTSYIDWCRSMQRQQLEQRQYEHCSLVDIQEWSGIPRDQALFKSLFVFENYPSSGLDQVDHAGLVIEEMQGVEQIDYPLCLVAAIADQVHMKWMYQGNVWTEYEVNQLHRSFCFLLEQIMEQPEKLLADIRLITEEEAVQFQQRQKNLLPVPPMLPYQFVEEIAWLESSQLAVVSQQQNMTYGQLNATANRLAHYLRKCGVTNETRVALLLDRSCELVIAHLAVHKAGGAFVPIDPAIPMQRVQEIIKDAEIQILLTHQRYLDEVNGIAEQVIALDGPPAEWEKEENENLDHVMQPDYLAYLIYTSGSTGKPKGVEITHRSLSNLIAWHQQEYEWGTSDHVTMIAGVSFDASVWEIWAALTSGATLHLPSEEVRIHPTELQSWLLEEGITYSFLPTPLMEQMFSLAWEHAGIMRAFLTGGDQLHQAPPADFPVPVVNHYGPTENTVVTTAIFLEPGEAHKEHRLPPIGRAIANVQLYVLNQYQQPVPDGIKGELYIGGHSLARGYHGQPDRTTEHFIIHPLYGRLYRTGDQVRRLEDGNLEFLGRLDQQVKIRGLRIELGEIEARLMQLPHVQECTVAPYENALIAYAVYSGEEIVDWKRELSSQLPAYMVPQQLIVLESMPVTPNGKVNRQALPKPEKLAIPYVAPRNLLEEQIAQIWSDVLNVDQVSVTASFFSLGGHSLLATQIVARVQQVFSCSFPLRQLMEQPTVEATATWIAEHQEQHRLPEIKPERSADDRYAPLSFAQQRLWLLDQLLSDRSVYNIPIALRLRGSVDFEALESSLKRVIERHESLRTRIVVVDQQPMQLITDYIPTIQRTDLQGEGSPEIQAAWLIAMETKRSFDLSKDSLLRIMLYQLDKEEAILAIQMHHMIADGWSMELFLKEWLNCYENARTGEEQSLPTLPIQYRDFAAWQKLPQVQQEMDRQLAYWVEQLSNLPTLQLPTDYPRAAEQTFHGATHQIILSDDLLQRLQQFTEQEGTTLFMIGMAAFQLLLGKWSGQTDFAVGSPIANRHIPEVESLIGFFVNTQVYRADLDGEYDFRQFMQYIRKLAIEAQAHQDVPFERVVEKVAPERHMSHSPLFQVMFTFQHSPQISTEWGQLCVEPFDVMQQTAKYDLTLTMGQNHRGKLVAIFEYNNDLFETTTIERMGGHFQHLLQMMCEEPERKLSSFSLLTLEEEQQLDEWNQTKQNDLITHPIPHLIIEKAIELPNAVAIHLQNQSFTYQQLLQAAKQLSDQLRRKLNIGKGQWVGLYMKRSYELIVAKLAVWLTGAAYIPLDPAYPTERIAFITEQSGMAALLVSEMEEELITQVRTQVFDYEQLIQEEQMDVALSAVEWDLDDPAYLIYTSGSTGLPKGVVITHRSLNNLVDWHIQQYQLTEQDRTSWLAGVAFDASVWEIWPTLVAGASLNIPNEMIRMVPEQLKNWYTEEKITLSFVPTPLLEQLYAVEWTKPVALRAILTGGDQLRMGPPRDFPVPVVNHYGPTENTVVTTSIELLPGKYEQTVPPIGYPISNVKVYVLDSDGKRVPIGVPGELWIGGNSLAEGYYCDSDLTAKRFIDHPQFGRLYQSGDQVRFLPTGHIEFLGRLDQQVKIRGFRIELGEIEHQLSKHEQVKEALVIADDQAGDKRLVAYVVPRSSGDWEEEWQTYLLQKLPDYMVPTQFIKLDAFPLTPNGKIDRRALPKPRASNSTSIVTTNDPIEEMIQKIWRDVLNQPIVGLEEDFFAIGGHSLLATQVISRVNQQYSIELPLRVLFEAKTIRKLAYHVKQEWKKIRDLAMPQLKQTVQIGERIPLSYAQQRLHFLNQLIQEPAAYNIPFAFYVHGEVDVEALQKSIQMLVERHASLRTAFVQEDGEWFQTIYEPSQSEISFEVMDYREHPSREAEVLVRLEKEAQFVFDLEHGPHFYCQLYLLSEEKSIFFINMHHIIADGWSIQIWLREWMECYEAAKKKVAYRKPGLPVQYIDYAAWQRSWLCGSVLEEQLQYWKEKLNHLPILQLPTDAPRPMKQTFAGNSYSIHLDHNLAKRLKEMSQKIDGTLFMTLLAAFEVLLYRWTGQQDFAIGTPVANRNVREVEECIGFFVNTLVLRSDLSESITFQKLLEQVKQTALEAYAHQEVPFERIVDEVQVERLLSHSPLIQVMFTLQNQPVEFPITEQFQLEAIPLQQKTAKFDLTLDMVEVEEGFIATFEYNTDLFEHQTIKWLGERWKLLLQQLIAEPKLPIEELGFVIEEEEKQLEIWNQTTVENQLDQPVHCLIEVQAEERPYSLALQHGASKLTYWQLNQRANQLAHYFKRIGLKANKPIMICLKRSIPYVIAQLAALKMGAIYLPVDPTQPLERIATLAKEANVQMIMAEPILSEPLSELGVRFFTWEMLEAETKHERVSNLSVSANLQSPAYLIFTSGSTGKPKGVAVSHESLLNLVYWHQRTYQVTANDRMSMLAGVAFDASVWEIWPTLASGASLHIPTEEERLNPVALQRFYLRERITHSFVPTPLLEQLLLLEWLEFGQLRYFLTGGDQLHQAPAQDFPITVINHYGPTENTVVATAGQVEAGSEQLPTIGRPIDNVTIYVLDQKMKQVPIGVPGELYLGGKSLAVGYYRQPDLTRERFIDHPDFGRLYRTGDQVRLRKNGEIEFLGRLDHQVKIRGFRIELGEVEVCLIGHPEVEEAVVIAHEGRLVAYIVGEIEPKELRRWAKERLPDYMVPTFYESMTFFPLTVNGKVDRKALPKPDESQWIHDGSYVAAKTEIEEALVTIWQDVLRQPKIGIHDNFFACGGDSILSIQVVARAGQLGLSLTPNQIFEHQTIAELAQVVEWRQPISAEQGLVEGDVPFSPIQQWFMEQEIPNRHHWNQSMMLLIGEQVDQKALEEAIRAIMGHHDVLRLRVAEDRSTHVQMDEPIPFDWVDLSGHPAAQHRSFIEQIAAEAQRSLHLQEGPIMRIVYFHLGDEEPDRLLWVIHHWVVDGVSWRILLEDLQTAYRQARQGEQIQLPAKTTSWKEWMNQLQNYAQSKQIQSEVAFWKGMQQHNPGKLPVDHPNGDNLQHTTRVVTQQLSIDETKELLETVGVKYRAHINELLISALAVAISRWTKSRQLMLHLEGHGREEMDGQVDVSRTVGWFTSIYPALIDLKQATTAGQVLREVKDSLRQIPNHGIGYGLYQYLQPVGQTMKPQQPIPLSFNYLGQFTMDQESSEGLLIGEALESQGMQMDPESERPHLLDLNAFVIGGQMTFTWLYSCQLFNQESIERVADEYMEGLRSLINDEEKSDLWSYTPSDFPEADLSKKDLQKVLSIIQKKRKR
ncbi:non-ribosomal peptide synthetase [Seinonella peptonophila]|nr:non-ribosomal peptide synthetase [Seinonella peptonophila]